MGSDLFSKIYNMALATNNPKILSKYLREVPGIGNKNAEVFAQGLYDKWKEHNELIRALWVIHDEEEKEYDKNILISGFRSNPDFEKICKENNFKISDSGSKYDLLVVTGDKFDGKKAIAAREKGIPVMLLSQFNDLYQNGGKLVWEK